MNVRQDNHATVERSPQAIAQHILRRSSSHLGAPWRIDAGLIAGICTVQACGCSVPETVDNPIPEGDYGWECSLPSQCD